MKTIRIHHSFIVVLFLVLGIHARTQAEFLISTRGYVSFAPYIHGQVRGTEFLPGYRADFRARLDLYRWGRVYLSGTTGNETLMHRPADSFTELGLDRIRYYISPALRFQGKRWFIRMSVKRESINKVSSIDRSKQYWWNTGLLGIGSRGSTQLHVRERYFGPQRGFLNLWDGQINLGKFIDAPGTIWAASRHPYQFEIFGNIRYHVGVFGHWGVYATLYGQKWFMDTAAGEHTISVTLNCIFLADQQGGGFYYTYVISDTFVPDNENKLGALGVRIIF